VVEVNSLLLDTIYHIELIHRTTEAEAVDTITEEAPCGPSSTITHGIGTDHRVLMEEILVVAGGVGSKTGRGGGGRGGGGGIEARKGGWEGGVGGGRDGDKHVVNQISRPFISHN